jgi:surfeit locus 1 family protein
MKRLPLLPTLFTALAVITMLGLGAWQLERREWKHALVARLAAARSLPPASPNEFLAAMIGKADLSYRRAVLPCRVGRVQPYDLKGGANRYGDGGFLVLVSCNRPGMLADIVAVAGWTRDANAINRPLTLDTEFAGMLVQHPYGDAKDRPLFMLIPDAAVPPLQPARQPRPEDLPDNHLSYALQWFSFAITLMVIYLLWLRRRPA